MAGGFLYELKRAFTGKTVIILVLVIVAFSYLSASSTAQTSAPGLNMVTNAYGYGSNETYHLVVHAYGRYGTGINGAPVNITLGGGKFLAGFTDQSGYANFTVRNTTLSKLEPSSTKGMNPAVNVATLLYNVSYTSGSSTSISSNYMSVYSNQTDSYFFNSEFLDKSPNGTLYNVTRSSGRYSINTLQVQGQPSRYALDMQYEGNVSITSGPVDIYYKSYQYQRINGGLEFGYNSSSLNETNMTFLGSYNGFVDKTVNPANLTNTNTSGFIFALFTPSGKILTSIAFQVYIPSTVAQVNSQFFGTEMTIVGFFIPLMASLSAYFTFGKDKTSGVLESTLSRPVTRRSLILSRYVANITAVFAAAIASFAVSSVTFSYYEGQGLPLGSTVYGLFGILVSICAFVGIVYFASGMLRTQGQVLSVAIGIFFIFDFFWTNIIAPVIPFIFITAVLKTTSGSIAFLAGYITMFYFSPSGYMNIASYIVTGTTPFYVSSGSITMSQLGISTTKFITGGILWIILPLILAVEAFNRKD